MDSALAHYRHTVAEHYAAWRRHPDPPSATLTFRVARDHLFKSHPHSALEPSQRHAFTGLSYAPYDAAWRMVVPIEPATPPAEIFTSELPEGLFRYQRIGWVTFTAPHGAMARLAVYWVLGYGGGLFLPFRDATNGTSTYGGGRYLYDTIKGADIGAGLNQLVLDFNMAYHPSCAYSPRWLCPLSPPENHLSFAVPVGELLNAA